NRDVIALEERNPGSKVGRVGIPVGQGRVCSAQAGRRSLDPGAELRHGAEVGVRLQPGIPGRRTQWLWPASGFESTGKRRAPRPNRKIVAAIRPMEMPHSTMEGQYECGATQGMRPLNVMAKRTTLARLKTTPRTASSAAPRRTSGRSRRALRDRRKS